MTHRKRMDVPEETNVLKEHAGISVGQEVHCYRYPDRVPSRGSVTSIHVAEGSDPYITFYCDATGQFRRALCSDVVLEPDDKIRRAVNKMISKEKKKSS
ncbi:MAG: hypothetical protein EBZ49_07555 [Proteobacteria bacterium]|nr:hypothetical protein [Pseudomonadota bacterium]